MAHLFNIPFSYNFIETLSKHIIEKNLELKNTLIFMPSSRSAKALQNSLYTSHKEKCILLPKIITYKNIFLQLWDLVEPNSGIKFDILKPPLSNTSAEIIVTSALFEVLEERDMNHLHHSAIKNSIFKAVMEYYYYSYNIDDLLNGTAQEKFLAAIIKKIEEKIKAIDRKLAPQLQHILNEQLLSNNELDKFKSIYAVPPIADIPYIFELFKILTSHDNFEIVLHGYTKYKNITHTHPCGYASRLLAFLNINDSNLIEAPKNDKDNVIEKIVSPNIFLQDSSKKFDKTHLDYIEIMENSTKIQEAKHVAIAIRNKLDSYSDNKIGVVLNDHTLARYLQTYLKKYGLECHYSGNWSVKNTPEIKFFMLLLEYFKESKENVILFLEILKHINWQYLREDDVNLEVIYKFEINYIRKKINIKTIKDYLTILNAENTEDYRQITETIKILELYKEKFHTSKSYSECFNHHIELLQLLISSTTKTKEITYRFSYLNIICETFIDTELVFNNIFNKLKDGQIQQQYEVILNTIIKDVTCQNPKSFNPYNNTSIEIVTSMEARFLYYDCIIICGLNEGSFPSLDEDHGMISQTIRRNFDKQSALVGYNFFDFIHLIAQNDVILSCNLETNRSRWFEVIKQYKISHTKIKTSQDQILEKQYETWQNHFYNNIEYKPIKRPSPKVNSNINYISATGIEKLINNPYLFYAEYILNLKTLDPINKTLFYKDFGIVLHDILSKINWCELNIENLKQSIDSLIQNVDAPGYILEIWKNKVYKIIKWLISNFNNRKIIGFATELEVMMSTPILNEYNQCAEITIYARCDKVELANTDVKMENLSSKSECSNLLDSKTLIITDYKTGSLPSIQDVLNGMAPQLAIQGILTEDMLINRKNLALQCCHYQHNTLINDPKFQFYYIQLKGNRDVGIIKNIPVDLEKAKIGLNELLKKFLLEKEARFFATFVSSSKYSHIDQLSRIQEWIA